MRYVFSILAFYTLLFSTQPAWQGVCEQWWSECCAGMVCGETAVCEAPADSEAAATAEVPICCPPFQCCFIAFPGFSTPYLLELKEFFEPKTKPQAYLKTLHSGHPSDCFHPPDH